MFRKGIVEAYLALEKFFKHLALATEDIPYYHRIAKNLSSVSMLLIDSVKSTRSFKADLPLFIFRPAKIFEGIIAELDAEKPAGDYSTDKLTKGVIAQSFNGILECKYYWIRDKDDFSVSYHNIGQRSDHDLAVVAMNKAAKIETDSLFEIAKVAIKEYIDNDVRLYEIFLRLYTSYLEATKDPRWSNDIWIPYMEFSKSFDPFNFRSRQIRDYRMHPEEINPNLVIQLLEEERRRAS